MRLVPHVPYLQNNSSEEQHLGRAVMLRPMRDQALQSRPLQPRRTWGRPLNSSHQGLDVPRKATAAKLEEISIDKMWDHQVQTLEFRKNNKRVFDFSSPGTGKTRAHIEAYAARPKPKGRLLVLCPKTLMVSAWGKDIERFAPKLTVSYAYADQRAQAFEMRTDVVVMNHDGVKWLADKANQRRLLEFDEVIIDEASAFKHSTSQRSKAMAGIRKYFEYRALLTGTPNPNTVMELWHPALILDDGRRLGTSYVKLRNAVQVPTQIGPSANHLRWDDKPGATQAVNELIADITIRHAFEDVMKHVPANHRHVKTFKLSAKAKKIYDQLERDCIAAFEDEVVTAVHAAALRTKLLQTASGATYTGGEDGKYALIDTARYELIADLIEERDHCVVFFNWKHQRDELVNEFDRRNLSYAIIDGSVPQPLRDDIVSRYQNGEYKVILLHPRTGAHGLTLTRGTTTIFSSPIYEADLMEQGIARIVRGVQDKVTDTIFIEAEGTVEKDVYARLNDKAANMSDLLDQMRQRSARPRK